MITPWSTLRHASRSIFVVFSLFWAGPVAADLTWTSSNPVLEDLENCSLRAIPWLELGTHRSGIGGLIELGGQLGADSFGANWALEAEGAVYEESLGIPCPSSQLSGWLSLGAGWGGQADFPERWFRPSSHRRSEISLKYGGYLSDDDTSQPTGGLTFIHSSDRFLLRVQLENDFLAFLLKDEYRTAALDLTTLFAARQRTFGVGFGLELWMGTTEGLGHLNRGDIYDMEEQHGGHWSHGIAYVSLIWEFVRLDIGWDSEQIRELFQNRLHELLDDGRIPLLDRPDRVFIQMTLFATERSY